MEVDRHKKRTFVGRYVMGRYDSDAYLKVASIGVNDEGAGFISFKTVWVQVGVGVGPELQKMRRNSTSSNRFVM